MSLRFLGLAVLVLLAGCGPSEDPGGREAGAEPAEAVARLGPHDGRDLPPADLDRVQVGDTAPDFTLDSYDDGVVTLSDFRGARKVVLVFYRGHW